MKRWRWMAAAMLIAAAQGGIGAEVAPPKTATNVAAVGTADAPTAASLEEPFRDPFAMRAGAGDGDAYIHAKLEAIPSGIEVVAILTAEGRPSVGALAIPGSKSLHFVQEGETIQLDSAGTTAGVPVGTQIYLLVKSITANQIEIAPQARPQDVRIYR